MFRFSILIASVAIFLLSACGGAGNGGVGNGGAGNSSTDDGSAGGDLSLIHI